MIKRLLNPNTLLKITLILTTLQLLPTSSWAAGDDYNLVIAGTTVTSSNASDILNDGNGGTGSVSFDGENTLTLNNARITINGKNAIESSLNNLNVYLVGESTITCQGNDDIVFKGTESNANITFSTSSSSYGSLQIQVNSENQLFSEITPSYPDELSLYNEGYTYTIEATKFNIKVANIDVTAANASNILGGQFQGIVSYDANNNTLTLNGATITMDETNPIIQCTGLNSLTIDIQGKNMFSWSVTHESYIVSNSGNEASLSFQIENEGVLNVTSSYYEGDYKGLCNGFNNVTFVNSAYYLNNRSKSIKQTELTPLRVSLHYNETNNRNELTFIAPEEFLFEGYYYKIDYVDTNLSGNGVEKKINNLNYSEGNISEAVEIQGPCTISTYAKWNNQTGNSAKAKYFGAPTEPQIIAFGKTTNLNIVPSINPEDGIKIDYIEGGGNLNEETGEVTVSGLGTNNMQVGLTYTGSNGEYSDGNTVILNNIIEYPITVTPPAPTITPNGGIIKNNQKISLTVPEAANDAQIYYSWNESNDSTQYEDTPFEEQAGMLKVWATFVDQPNQDAYPITLKSTVITAVFLNDISNAYIPTIQNKNYTGETITPEITIKENNSADAKTLEEGTDYTVNYYTVVDGEIGTTPVEMKNVGNYKIVITGKGNYGGELVKDFTIDKGYAGLYFYRMDGAQESPVNTIQNATYGVAFDSPKLKNPHNLTVTLSCKAENSPSAAESDVATIDSEGTLTILKAGRVYVYATTEGNANYEAQTEHYVLNIDKTSLNNVTIADIADKTFTGSAIEPAVTVTLNGEDVSTDDYSVSYINNINVSTDANKATITLTAKSTSEHFTEGTTKTATFNIVAKSITDDMIQAIADQTYSFGNAITPTVTVKDGETTLTLATTADDTGDYSVAYSNNTNAAKSTDETAPTVTITGKGNYTGTASKTFTINPMAVATATISLSDATLTYNGAAQHPTISSIEGNNSEGSTLEFTSSDYTISYEQNDNTLTADDVKNAGGYTLVAIFGGNYSGTATTTFNIAAKDLSDAATIATIPDQTYTGNEIKPEPAVSIVLIDGNDATTLTKGTDFDYSYANNINASEQAEVQPTVTITGKGNYTGSASQTFSITNATMTVTATGYNGTYDGNTHGITVTAPEGATVKYGTKKGTYDLDASPTYTDAGSYMVHYQVVKTNYATIADSAKVEITKATPSITFDEESYTATYGAEFTAPTASTNPEGLTVTATSSSNTQVAAVADGVITITGIGETTITVSFAGNNNYEAATTTYKLNVAAGAITGITATGYTGTYDGNAHGITVTAPEGASIKYETKKGTYDLDASPTYTDAGSYMVHYQVERTNYATITDSAKVEITKATPSITFDKESYSATYGEAFTAPTASTNPEGLTVTATSSSNTQVATISDGVITIVGVGETTITVSFAGSNNYEATTATYKLNVAAGTIIGVTATGYSDVYDGKAHGITVTAPEGATIKYGTKKGTYNLDQSPTFSDAGTYMVHYQVECTNYTTLIDSVKVEITKVNITPSITLEGWTYGTTANTPVVTGNTGNGTETFTYKAEGSDAFTSEVPTAVGTHTVKVTIGETTNYNGGEATTTFAITNRTIDPAKDITFAEGQSYASFYSANEDLVLPESGIAVYMITGIEVNTLITQAVSYIPKGVPVLIEKTETAVEAKDPSEVGTNMLQYATEDVAASGTLYILYNGEYVKATGTIPQGKCYLKLNKPSGARILTIGNNNGTTSISNFNADTETDRWFDLNGQRISKPQKKGLYIKNGKKIVVK